MFSEADKQFDLVFSALKTGRSLAASYNLQTDIQCLSCVPRPFRYESLFEHQFSYTYNQTKKQRCSNHKYLLLSRSRKDARVPRSFVILMIYRQVVVVMLSRLQLPFILLSE